MVDENLLVRIVGQTIKTIFGKEIIWFKEIVVKMIFWKKKLVKKNYCQKNCGKKNVGPKKYLVNRIIMASFMSKNKW